MPMFEFVCMNKECKEVIISVNEQARVKEFLLGHNEVPLCMTCMSPMQKLVSLVRGRVIGTNNPCRN